MTKLRVANFPDHRNAQTSTSRHAFEPIGLILRRNECRHCYLAESTHHLYNRIYGDWWTQARPYGAKGYDGWLGLFALALVALISVLERL